MAQIAPSAVYTATQELLLEAFPRTSPVRAFMLTIHVTVAGTTTLTPTIQLQESHTDTWFDFHTLGAISAATGDFVYIVREDEPVSASPLKDVHARAVPPADDVRVRIVHGDASSWTYSVAVFWY